METLREECGLSRSTVKRLVGAGSLSLHPPPHGLAERLPELPAELRQAKDSIGRGPTSGCSVLLRPAGLSLHGLWGHMAGHALSEGKAVLVLLPEVASAREVADRFESWFPGRVALLHGGMTPGQRENAWSRITSGRTPLVVGTRSAVFAPLNNVGLAIMEDEHDPAYKNEETPRYHARRVLLTRASRWEARVVLSSAAPCLESYRGTLDGKLNLVNVQGGCVSAATLIDMTDPSEGTRSWHLSRTLAADLRRVVDHQLCAVLVHNRRGYASFLVCKDCGLVPRCTRCDVPLAYHRGDKQMRCHHCGSVFGVPDTCTRCNGINLVPRGTGTERIQTDVQRLVPAASVVCLEAGRPAPDVEHANIVVATQAILRHVPWERVATVALLEAELSLGFPDFRAGERTFQLITALRDWATRCSSPPRLIVQSRSPQTPCIQLACEGRYHDYAVEELAARRAVGYPPYQSLVRVEIASPDESEALRVAKNAGRRFSRIAEVLGPAPAPIPKLRGRFRYQLLVRSDPDTDLPYLVCKAAGRMRPPRGLRLIVDADPVSMM